MAITARRPAPGRICASIAAPWTSGLASFVASLSAFLAAGSSTFPSATAAAARASGCALVFASSLARPGTHSASPAVASAIAAGRWSAQF